jgi:cysteine desulfurase / selenocysteine lyase
MIYLDNAATSFPKPPEVTAAVLHFMTDIGANPGRSGHRLSMRAGDIVFRARKSVAQFFGLKNPMHVVFTANATEALNLAIKGVLRPGDSVLISTLEHNSVIRPLTRMKNDTGIRVTILSGDDYGRISVEELQTYHAGQNPAALIMNHTSNVTGAVQPVQEIGKWCRSNNVLFILDCAQSAGIWPLDMSAVDADLVAFSGHKGLLGPPGTGGLLISDNFDHNRLNTLKEGGTGSSSEKTSQPDFLPDKYESGTLNTPGLAGLEKGVQFLMNYPGGLDAVRQHKCELQTRFLEQAHQQIEGFMNFSAPESAGIVSFLINGLSSSEITMQLSRNFDIMSRQGLHCAPLAHRKSGTFPAGTVRFSPGIFNTAAEIDDVVAACRKISRCRMKESE